MAWKIFLDFSERKNSAFSLKFLLLITNLIIVLFWFESLNQSFLMQISLLFIGIGAIYAFFNKNYKSKILICYLSIILVLFLSFYFQFDLEQIEEFFVLIPLLYVFILPGSLHPIFFALLLSFSFIYAKDYTLAELIEDLLELIVINVSATIISILFIKNKKQYEKLSNSYYQDDLTKVPNLHGFRLILSKVVNEKQKTTKILYHIDVNHFKYINDQFGHDKGDELLILLAKRLKSLLTEDRFLFRIDGDEFAILQLTEVIDEELIEKNAKEILDTLLMPLPLKDRFIHLTFNMGVSFSSAYSNFSDNLISNGKDALHESKILGENTYSLYNDEIQRKVERKRLISFSLKTALEDNEFFLVFQPKVTCQNKIIGFEALLRWEHKKLGLISPFELIPIAEEKGYIIPIGLWVIEESLKMLNKVRSYGNYSLSANLSALQLTDVDLLDNLTMLIEKYQVEKGSFELELTESSLMLNPELSISTLTSIKELGIKISIDDFGIAFSSLSYLQKIPLDILKVDRSFIKDIKSSSENHPITESIINLGHSLNLDVIVEGIETNNQLEYIKNYNPKGYQGYLYSKPIEHHKVLELLSGRD